VHLGRLALAPRGLDPRERAEFHLRLAERLLREAGELLARVDYIQAPGKAREARVMKAVTAGAGRELESHGDL